MADHSSRAHAVITASGSGRWIACPPSVKLEQLFPDTTSEAAKEGTLAHEMCEIKARARLFRRSDAGYMAKNVATRELNKLRKDPLFDDEMEGHSDDYAAELDLLALGFEEKPHIYLETKLDLSDWIPEGYGTADCIMVGGDRILVADFKYGKGVRVEAEGNTQMQLYALGAWKKFSLVYDIKRVMMVILQPRLSANPSVWETSIEDLIHFGEYAKERAQLAAEGLGDYNPGEDQCRFCRARQRCRARADYDIQLAFGGVIGKLPPLITNEEVGEYLAKGEDVAKWLKDLQDYALGACLAGDEIPGYKAVEGRGSRDWTDQEAAFKALQASGVPESVLYERKALTLAALEKVVGKKAFGEVVGSFIEKKPGKPALVKASDKRPAITNVPSVEEAFEDLINLAELRLP